MGGGTRPSLTRRPTGRIFDAPTAAILTRFNRLGELAGWANGALSRRAHADCRSDGHASLCPPREAPTELRFERGDISGNRDDVVVGKLLDHCINSAPGPSALAGRHEVELPRDVHGRLTRKAWHLAEAIERAGDVTDALCSVGREIANSAVA